ncbi:MULTISPECIES: DUF3256 family protein [unclassified Prevotella]|uniref:DUF3256 family protein n=1 Tax=unclassified Prevotella TaxID=2638335 RepID=UPI0006872915|nr:MULTISPECIES: DUF3256 family protein [unclassified Prevotella]
MKKILMALLMAATFSQASAADVQIRDVFREMPDSLMPYLSKNNRLDFIDFLDSGMKAEVKNSLGGTSEMTSIADDSLSIRMSDGLRVDMLLMDSVVVMVETFTVDSVYGESRVHYYSVDWKPLAQPCFSGIQAQRIKRLKMQNIVKRDDDLLNKR